MAGGEADGGARACTTGGASEAGVNASAGRFTGAAVAAVAAGAPDLRDRFIVSTGSAYSYGDTGGADSVTLSTSEIPSHTHDLNHNHTYSSSTSSDSHTHRVRVGTAGGGGGGNVSDRDSEQPGSYVSNQIESDSHAHSFSGTTAAFNGASQSTGGGGSHENRPPYYALCYIMKT